MSELKQEGMQDQSVLVWLDRLAFYSWLLAQPAGKVVGYIPSLDVNPLACYLRDVTGCFCLVYSISCKVWEMTESGTSSVRRLSLPLWVLRFVAEVNTLVALTRGRSLFQTCVPVTRERALEALAHIPEEVEV